MGKFSRAWTSLIRWGPHYNAAGMVGRLRHDIHYRQMCFSIVILRHKASLVICCMFISLVEYFMSAESRFSNPQADQNSDNLCTSAVITFSSNTPPRLTNPIALSLSTDKENRKRSAFKVTCSVSRRTFHYTKYSATFSKHFFLAKTNDFEWNPF